MAVEKTSTTTFVTYVWQLVNRRAGTHAHPFKNTFLPSHQSKFRLATWLFRSIQPPKWSQMIPNHPILRSLSSFISPLARSSYGMLSCTGIRLEEVQILALLHFVVLSFHFFNIQMISNVCLKNSTGLSGILTIFFFWVALPLCPGQHFASAAGNVVDSS